MIEKWMEVRYKKQSSGCCAMGKKVLQEDKNILPLFPQNLDGKSSKMKTRKETWTGRPLRWAREEQVVWEMKDHWPKNRHRYWHRHGVNNRLVFFDRNVWYSSRWGPDPLDSQVSDESQGKVKWRSSEQPTIQNTTFHAMSVQGLDGWMNRHSGLGTGHCM